MRIGLSHHRRLAGIAFVAALAAVLAACGSSGGSADATKATGPLRIAVVPKAVGFDFWRQVESGAKCAATKHKDVQVLWTGVKTETDVTGQVELLQNFISGKVDGIVYAATDAQVLADVTRQAEQAGIRVINVDSGTAPQPQDVPVFATDNVAAAERVAGLLQEQIGSRGGDIAFIPFQEGTATNDQRTQGFKAGLAKTPDLRLVATQSSQSDYDRALQVTKDILATHRDLKGIFAANEPGVRGAAAAVRRAGRTGKVKIVGWDASPDAVAAVRAGVVDALIVQNPFRMGYDAVDAMVKSLRSGTPAVGADTGVTVVTRANVDSPRVKAVLNPSCADPPA